MFNNVFLENRFFGGVVFVSFYWVDVFISLGYYLLIMECKLERYIYKKFFWVLGKF